MVGLSNRANDKVETYSKGMRQRLQIARGLINDPEIIFLDEPTIGLDPVAAKELRLMIKQMKMHGKTILLTTHYMFEADELCDRIAIINNGKIIAIDEPEILKEKYSSFKILEAYFEKIDENDLEKIKRIEGVLNVIDKTIDDFSVLTIQCSDINMVMNSIIKEIEKEKIIRINHRSPLLEDVYINLVGNTK